MDDLGGCDVLVFTLHKLVTLCETTFTQELAFDILTEADFTIRMFHFFFNDLLILSSDSGLSMQVGLTATMLWRRY